MGPKATLPMGIGTVICGAVLLALFFHRSIVETYEHPSGQYTAQLTYRTYLSLLPMMPGSSGDKPGFVEVFDVSEGSLGKMPVPMLSSVRFEWTDRGASVWMVGDWDFDAGTCRYWNEHSGRGKRTGGTSVSVLLYSDC